MTAPAQGGIVLLREWGVVRTTSHCPRGGISHSRPGAQRTLHQRLQLLGALGRGSTASEQKQTKEAASSAVWLSLPEPSPPAWAAFSVGLSSRRHI